MGGCYRGGRALQRARRIHRLYRLRVDFPCATRQQPPPGRDLPRRRGQGLSEPAVHRGAKHRSGGPLGGPRGLRAKDRWEATRDSTQRQSLQWHDVRAYRYGRKPAHPFLCGRASSMGARLRGHADQGRRRGPSVLVAERRVCRLRDMGQGQPQSEPSEEEGHVAVRVRPLRSQARPSVGEEARGESLQVRNDRLHRLTHIPRGGRRGELLRQALRH